MDRVGDRMTVDFFRFGLLMSEVLHGYVGEPAAVEEVVVKLIYNWQVIDCFATEGMKSCEIRKKGEKQD